MSTRHANGAVLRHVFVAVAAMSWWACASEPDAIDPTVRPGPEVASLLSTLPVSEQSHPPRRLQLASTATVEVAAVHGDTLFMIDSTPTLHAIDLGSGAYRWQRDLDRRPNRPIVVDDALIAVLSQDHVAVFERGNGRPIVGAELRDVVTSDGALTSSSLYFGHRGDGDGLRAMVVLDARPGWSCATGASIRAAPVLCGRFGERCVVVATDDGRIIAVPALDADYDVPPRPLWTATIKVQDAALLGTTDAVFVHGPEAGVVRLDAATGAVAWSAPSLSGRRDGGLSRAPDTVFVSVGGRVAAVDEQSGRVRYRADAERFVTRIGAFDYLATGGGIVAVAAQDGAVEGEVRDSRFRFVPADVDGQGRLVLLGPSRMYQLH